MFRRAAQTVSVSPIAEKVIKGSMARGLVRRFVAGENLGQALRAIESLANAGMSTTLDLLGEDVADSAGADTATAEYLAALDGLSGAGLSATVAVKPSQLGVRIDEGVCRERLNAICAKADGLGTSVELDMEASSDVDSSLRLYGSTQSHYPSLRVAIQAYLRRSPFDLARLGDGRPRIRLVKGAYAEATAVALRRRSDIDAQFAFLSEWLCLHGAEPAFATHDERLIGHAREMVSRHGINSYEIQMLYGVRTDLQRSLAAEGVPVRIYVPFGPGWYAYLSRRLAERPANFRFLVRAVAGE